MKKIYKVLSIIVFALILLIPASAFAYTTGSPIYACEPVPNDLASFGDPNFIHEINQTNGEVISSVAMSGTIFACGGLTVDPTTNIFYISSGNQLRTINVTSGVTTNIGSNALGGTGCSGSSGATDCTSLVFDGSGNLFLTAEDNADDSIINRIDKSDSSIISSCNPSTETLSGTNIRGDPITFLNREPMAFNYDNDKMYRITTNPLNLEVIDPITCVISETVAITGIVSGFPYSFTYNTADDLFNMMVKESNYEGEFPLDTDYCSDCHSDYYTLQTDGTATLITDEITNTHAPSFDPLFTLPTWFIGLVSSIFPDPPDSVAPIISGTESEPITLFENETFLPFDKVQCIDDIDGTIIPNGNFGTDGGITIDTSNRGTQYQDYTCTDSATNNSLQTIEYIIKKESGGQGGSPTSNTQDKGGTTSTPNLNDIPLLENIPTLSLSPDQQVRADEVEAKVTGTISDLFANLFTNRLDADSGERIDFAKEINERLDQVRNDPTGTTNTIQERISPIADFIRDLFSGFFR